MIHAKKFGTLLAPATYTATVVMADKSRLFTLNICTQRWRLKISRDLFLFFLVLSYFSVKRAIVIFLHECYISILLETTVMIMRRGPKFIVGLNRRIIFPLTSEVDVLFSQKLMDLFVYLYL